jgi:signal transduction histidine kinase
VYYRQREVESQFAKLSADHERILQIEKLSAMGQMVSEIAHQLNNPLVGVINLAQLAEREVDNPQRVKELLGEVHKAGEHCRNFVQRMLRFTKVARSEPRPTEMKGLTMETIVFFQQSVGGPCAVTLEAPDHDVILEVDPVLMRHALFNLIHNAVQANPTGAVVVSISPDEREGISGWCLAVSDCGPGITREVADKLFTPFFSTKTDGTGLGLSVAQHIVNQHGGSLRAENKPNGGSRFIIWLPAYRGNHERKNTAG